MRPNPPTPLSSDAIRTSRSLALVSLLALLTTCRPAGAAADPFGLGGALGSAPISPRLSVATAFRACPEAVPVDGTILRARCPAPPAETAARLARVAARARQADDDPAALHALALVDLVADDSTGRTLERAISTLRQVAALADHPAAPLADLSAALIVRAERTQAPRDLLEAYETAEQALRGDPRSPAALYNRALALDRFGLVDETAKDWQAYLAADSTSGWADDARRRRRDALAVRAPAPPAEDAPLSAYTAYAAADPQGARELGMDRLLAEWGQAVEAGDASRAADRLRRAAALADALERRPGADASLGDMVRAVRAAAADPAATPGLARAHREYGAGVALYGRGEYADAEPRFEAASRVERSAALRGWAGLLHATAKVHNRAAGAGERLQEVVASLSDGGRYPALVARGRWSVANTLARGEKWEPALAEALVSAAHFARAGERVNEGAALNIVTDARFTLGEPDSGYAAMHRSMTRLRPYRGALRLHNLCLIGGRIVATDGLLASAVALHDEGVGVATRTGEALYLAEARLARARLLAAAGDAKRAQADVDGAGPLIRKVQAPVSRAWMEADLREVRAVMALRTDPDRATQALDSAAAYFGVIPFRALPALVGGAEARLVDGDAAGAVARLERAIGLLDQRRQSIRMEPRRAAVFDAARGALDRIVMLHLSAGRTVEALDYLDRGRASLAPAGPRAADARDEVRGPPGEVIVEYAMVHDTLIAWTVRGRRVDVFRTAIDSAALVSAIRGVEEKLESGAAEAEVRAPLATLYDWLIRPLRRQLGVPGTPVVFIADGDLAAVPFAALHDRGRYLVEDHPLRFAVSLREARRPRERDAPPGVLLVADPAFDPGEHPLLDRLPHAAAEVRRLGGGYAGARLLEGARATRGALKQALPGASLVHFSGHAVFDDERPERSYLVLAPGPGESGKITAGELAGLDLRHVRLVVLSACRTIRSGGSRAGGFSGLSGALLAAGAGATVGSTWRVDDRHTAALMTEFHRRYRTSRDGPRALAEAQRALLRSTSPALRSPAAWASFRYVGA